MSSTNQVKRVAIVTPLQEELRALMEALDQSAVKVIDGPFQQFKTRFESIIGNSIDVHIFSQPSLGHSHAAALVTYIHLTLEVDMVVVVGTCGAIRHTDPTTGHDIELGDVIFSDSVVGAEIRKFIRGEFEVKSESWRADPLFTQAALKLQDRILSKKLFSVDGKTNEWFSSADFSMHCGSVISLGSVIADTAISKKLSKIVEKSGLTPPIAIEMEASGVLAAASIFRKSGNVAMIRGVSDFADDHKNDGARKIACINAAFVSLEFIRSYF